MITAPIILSYWKPRQPDESEISTEISSDIQVVTCDISRKAKLAKRASVHTSKGHSSCTKPTLDLDQSCQSSVPDSWAFLAVTNSTPTVIDSRASSLSPHDNDDDDDDDDDDCDESSKSSNSTAASTPSSSSPIPSSASIQAPLRSLKDVAYEDLPDQELLRTLAAFLRGGSSHDEKKSTKKKNESRKLNDSSPNSPGVCDLVVTVRDFAYPKSHPYHNGDYPPESSSEGSDDEDEDEGEDDEDDVGVDGEFDAQAADQTMEYPTTTTTEEEERSCGHARGLYDFDAENSTELTFKEGDYMWIHCLQFPGWFLGEIDGQQGLVPSNYVELV
ncbi:hypothetical protein BGZ76_008812 [Entomortierella beljakovae]|nr:hypothetical protein BGZ76_008812 [Entomortierella beljakovae]